MRSLLWPFGLVFMLLVWLRSWLYNCGIFRSKKLERPVIALGNLSTGGTGKTPWVQALTEYFAKKNKKVVILSRGYTGDYSGVLEVTPDMDPRRCGDEPLWLSQKTEARVYVGRKRWDAGKKALEDDNVDLFILDDAFQHRGLKRDCDIVLLDASAPRLHYWPLPVGYLREGFMALKRAQIVIINKCNYSDPRQLTWLEEKCLTSITKDRLFFSEFVFSHWSPLVKELTWSEPGEVKAMTCGVGNPEAFLKTLQEQGVEPVRKFIFPDHHYWKPDDIERMTYHMKTEGCHDLMITEKDAVKLQRYKKHFLEMQIQMWICKMTIELREREKDFFEMVEASVR